MASLIPQRNSAVYVLNTGFSSAEMMNFFLNPAADTKYENNVVSDKIIQTKIPQNGDDKEKTFNDRTRKSLLKINLFIKRLKWFNIFTNNQQTNKIQKTSTTMATTERQQKCEKVIATKTGFSTKEMYREAAKLLGIDCSLSSSCRCMDCQSRYFDYDPETEQLDDSDSDESCDDSDADSYTSEYNDHLITNCYLIHSEELCECCQMRNERKSSEVPAFSECMTNDLSFNNFLS